MNYRLAAIRRPYAALDVTERQERMLTELGLGWSKAESHSVTDEADAAFWDATARQLASPAAVGKIVAYDIDG
jgi:hypothetical protein